MTSNSSAAPKLVMRRSTRKTLKPLIDKIFVEYPNLKIGDIIGHDGKKGIRHLSGIKAKTPPYYALVGALKKQLFEERGFRTVSRMGMGIEILTADGVSIEGGKYVARGMRQVHRGGEWIESVDQTKLSTPARKKKHVEMRKSLKQLGWPFSEEMLRDTWKPVDPPEALKPVKLKTVKG